MHSLIRSENKVMEKIVSNDTFTRPKKTGQVKFIPQQPGGSPAMFFSVHTGWEQNKAEQTAAAARRRRQCGGSAAGTGSRRQRAKPSKKGVHLHEKKGGWIPSLPIHQSLRPFATAAWPAAPPPLPRVVLTGFFQTVNGATIARWAMPDRDGKPLFS